MAVGILVACIPTLRPVFFPHRFGSSAANHYNGRSSGAVGSSARARLHGYRKRSFSGQSLQNLERDDIELGELQKYGGSKSHVSAGRGGKDATTPRTTASDEIGVKTDIEISRISQ